MLLHGDELGRTQQGNNNTYAQDNDLSWVHWDEADQPLLEFAAAVIGLRRSHPTFRRRRFFTGIDTDRDQLDDIDVVTKAITARFLEWQVDPDNNRAPGATCMGSLTRLRHGAH